MAAEAAATPAPTAQMVGNAFIEQYYLILHKSPESVHRFYQDSSVLSRPDPNGLMTTVTTIKGINEKICSFDYKNYTTEIKTADAQDSHKDGVIVLVTGSLTGPDNIRKNFTQIFFLAPQEKGYFVSNDVFRYVENSIVPLENSNVTTNETNDSVFPTPTPEPAQVVNSPVVNSAVQDVEQKVHDQVTNERELSGEKDAISAPETQLNKTQISKIAKLASPIVQEDAPKKSYALILRSQTNKGVLGANKSYISTNITKASPKKIEIKVAAPVARAENAAKANGVEKIKDQEAEGHSIYIRNLPINVKASDVEDEFKKFGPIKQRGVQVRNNKQRDSCFGFVHFQNLSSMNDAVKASPITIGGWKAIVEIKKSTNRVGSEGGKTFSGRREFRNNSFRGRENNVSGRGYGRNNYSSRGEFSGGQIYQGRSQGGSDRIAVSTIKA